jgi:hypothetical protein
LLPDHHIDRLFRRPSRAGRGGGRRSVGVGHNSKQQSTRGQNTNGTGGTTKEIRATEVDEDRLRR